MLKIFKAGDQTVTVDFGPPHKAIQTPFLVLIIIIIMTEESLV